MWSQERIRELIETIREQLPGSILKQEILACLEENVNEPAGAVYHIHRGEEASARKEHFKQWGVTQLNRNGVNFTPNVINAYCVGLNTYGRKLRDFAQTHDDFNGGLTDLLLAHESLFEVTNLEEFEQIKIQLRQLLSYERFSAVDHGTRHAAMDLYERFLRAVN